MILNFRDPSKTLNFRRRGSMGSREGDDKLTEVDKVSIEDPVTKVLVKDPVAKMAFKDPAAKVSIVDLVKSASPHYNQLPVIKAEEKGQGNSNYKKKEVDEERRSGNKILKEVQQNPGNWPLVNSDVFLDWTNSIQPNAKAKRV